MAFWVPSTSLVNAANCTQNSTKQCISNISYWYNSCGALQSVYQNCNLTNQTCQNGECIGNTASSTTNQNSINTTTTNYVQNYRTNCYNNNIYWYSSTAIVQGIYKNCTDTNTCTLDNCQDNACINIIKCDGSTCAINSADYITYCKGSVAVNPVQNQNLQTQSGSLSVSFFGAKESNPTEWQKTINASNNEHINFLVTVKNSSQSVINDVTVTANLGTAVSYSGNLKINNIASTDSIVSGINIGTLPAATSNVISFSAIVQMQTNQAVPITVKVNSGAAQDFDTVTINATTASTQNNLPAASDNVFISFIKQWYLWTIVIIVLIGLFIIIFRRLSSNV